jgi:lysophospholipase L1-like esterase
MLLLRRYPALLLLLLATSCAARPALAPDAPPEVPAQVSDPGWEQDMQRFAAEDARTPPPQGGVLFIGSSSIRMWDSLANDFPGVPVIKRGFGGSELRDSTWYADRIIVPYRPRLVVLYAGENDLHSGRSPQQVHRDFVAFVRRVRRDLPGVRIAYIASKPSPSRAGLLEAQRQANALIRRETELGDGIDFIDVFTPMLDAQGKPRQALFIEDRLHLNRAGYLLWRDIIAPYLR